MFWALVQGTWPRKRTGARHIRWAKPSPLATSCQPLQQNSVFECQIRGQPLVNRPRVGGTPVQRQPGGNLKHSLGQYPCFFVSVHSEGSVGNLCTAQATNSYLISYSGAGAERAGYPQDLRPDKLTNMQKHCFHR